MSKTGFNPQFVNMQLHQDLESNSEEVQVIENPDLTTGVGKQKKKLKKKRDRDVEEAVVIMMKMMMMRMIMCTQSLGGLKLPHPRSAIAESAAIRVWLWMVVVSESDIVVADTAEEKDWQTFIQEKDDVEEQLNRMKRKLEELMWDERAHGYREDVKICVQ